MGTTSYYAKKFKEFFFDPKDEVAEAKSKWNPTKSAKKKSPDSPVHKYTFLQTFGVMEPKGKKLTDEPVIIDEDDDSVKERVFRSDTSLQSSSSNHNAKSFSGSKHSDSFTPKPLKAVPQRNEPVSLISDDENDNSSTTSNVDIEDLSEDEQIIVQETTSHDIETGVTVHPSYVEFGKDSYLIAKLTFFSSSIKLDVEESTNSLSFEWKIVDVISIQSHWSEPDITADVFLYIKLEDSKEAISDQKSGILKVKFSISDSDWSCTQVLIKSLNEHYKEIWDVDLDSYESFEDITYRGDSDSISISKRDFELLNPEKFINDTIVDFYIEYLKKVKPGDERVHFFNSFFFRKLADFDENQLQMFDAKSAFQKVRKWTKKVNVFQKDYIFIPVNFRLHWSLIVICHPGEVVKYKDDKLEVSTRVPCILHMDSIKGSHRGIENCIKCYLWEEWKERSNRTSEYINSKFKDMLFLRLEVPQQENSYDCGLFMLHYMELFMKQAPINFNPLNNFISKDWFYPTEASLKRARVKRLIVELSKNKSEQILSPNEDNSPDGNDVNTQESEDVEILNEPCHGTEVDDDNKSTDVTPILEVESQSEEIMETEDNNGGAIVVYNEENHMVVPYDHPSIINKESNEIKEVVEDSKADKTDTPFMEIIDKSLNLLHIKENQPCGRILGSSSTTLGGDDDKAVVVEEKFEEYYLSSSSDDEVFETCVVEDSDSDDDSGQPSCYRGKLKNKINKKERRKVGSCLNRKDEVGSRWSLRVSKRRNAEVSEAQKRLKKSEVSGLQEIILCE